MVREAVAGASFQPSDTFQGKRDGFHFKAGPEGTGYYPDAAPPAVPASEGKGAPVTY